MKIVAQTEPWKLSPSFFRSSFYSKHSRRWIPCNDEQNTILELEPQGKRYDQADIIDIQHHSQVRSKIREQ
jgi:hypothetical protein